MLLVYWRYYQEPRRSQPPQHTNTTHCYLQVGRNKSGWDCGGWHFIVSAPASRSRGRRRVGPGQDGAANSSLSDAFAAVQPACLKHKFRTAAGCSNSRTLIDPNAGQLGRRRPGDGEPIIADASHGHRELHRRTVFPVGAPARTATGGTISSPSGAPAR